MQAGLKMSKMGKYVHLYASFSCSVNIYNTKEVLCALNLNSSESSHVGSLSLYQWRTEKGGFGMYFMLFISSEWSHDGSLSLYQWRAEKGGFGIYIFHALYAPQRGAMLVHSIFTNEEQRKVVLWCIWYSCHTCWPCSWHHWLKLLGTKWQHSWSCFHSL